jgi:ubiquinone/menaquinone biosynthesis C-methylase UbiE
MWIQIDDGFGSEEMNFNVERAVRPDAAAISAAPMMSPSDVAAGLLADAGHRALDVGCGRGPFTQVLVGLFSDVSGIDPRGDLIARGRSAACDAGLTIDYREGVAEDLPFEAASFDAVSFSNSLHHFTDFAAAFAEARRVLVSGGLLYVMEPIPAGSYFEATRLVNDETEVRTAAYEAMSSADGWVLLTELTYRRRTSFASFAEWKALMIERSANRRKAFDRAEALIRDRFESEAEIENGRLVLDHLHRVDLLRRL